MSLRRQSVLQEQMDIVVVAARQWRRDALKFGENAYRERDALSELASAVDRLEEMSAKIERTSTGTAKNATRKSGPRRR